MRDLMRSDCLLALACANPALAMEPVPEPIADARVVALAPVPAGKLTAAAQPRSYRLDLTVDPAQERFSGKVEIEANLSAPTKFIDLHGRDLAMKRATVSVAGRIHVGRWTQLEDTGVARLVFDEALPAGPVMLAFDYDAPFQSSPAGMFRVKVGEEWYSWTQFQSIDGRAAFPSFDEPGFKTPFTVTLRTRPGQAAISNAPELSVTREGDFDVHRFAPTLPLPTYLMAMMVGPFAVLEGEVPPTPQRAKPLPVRIVSPKPNAAKLSYALEGTKDIVRQLETYFADAFPYPKLDQITSPIMPGAMENAGADLYADSILIVDEKDSVDDQRTFGMVVSHELGHQWFGDLVTPAWWDDIWLNESFANWMGYRIGHQWRPDLNIASGALAEGFSAMNTDSLVAGRAIQQPITRNAEIDEAFDSITYGKGGHVVAMIAGFMGDARFQDGVRRYMAAHRYGSATSTDFFQAMAEASGNPAIVPAMQGFIRQQGVPLLTFAGGKDGRFAVTQSRYSRLGLPAPETRWGVPMCLRRGKANHCELLTADSAEVAIGGRGALVPNAGGTGYYRFELPRTEWDRLIASADRLPGGEALAVSDSLLASFRAGRSDATQLVALARKLVRNPDSQASDEGFGNLAALAAWGVLDEAGQASLRKLVRASYAPRLKALGFDPRAGAHARDSAERAQLRLLALNRMAGTARDPMLLGKLAGAAEAFLGGDKAALDPALYGLGFEAWLGLGGPERARRLVDKALASEDPAFRPAALRAAAASGKLEVARWLLEEFADPRLRRSERNGMIRGVIDRETTRDYGYGWLKTNLDKLMSGTNGIFFASRLPGLVGGFCGVARADELAAELRPRFAGKTGALDLERAIERVRACGLLKDARGTEASRQLGPN